MGYKMKKTYKRTYKKRTYRKRSFKKRAKKNSPMRRIRYMKDKFTTVLAFKATGESNNAYLLLLWQLNFNSSVAQTGPGFPFASLVGYGYDKTNRWASYNIQNWDEYAITGMSYKYMPTLVLSTVVNNDTVNLVGGIQIIDDINSNGNFPGKVEDIFTTDNAIALKPDRTYKKYIPLKKLAQALNLDWLKTTQYASGSMNGLSLGSTLICALTYNMPSNIAFAYVKVTWYVTFRGQ